MTRYYLEGHDVRVAKDTRQWAEWFEEHYNDGSRVVGNDTIEGVRVSTVFLGIDHNFLNEGPPLLFETMVFGGVLHEEMERCATWDGAEKQHAAMLARVLATVRREP